MEDKPLRSVGRRARRSNVVRQVTPGACAEAGWRTEYNAAVTESQKLVRDLVQRSGTLAGTRHTEYNAPGTGVTNRPQIAFDIQNDFIEDAFVFWHKDSQISKSDFFGVEKGAGEESELRDLRPGEERRGRTVFCKTASLCFSASRIHTTRNTLNRPSAGSG